MPRTSPTLSQLDAALFAAIARRDGDEALALIGRGADINALERYDVVIDRDRYTARRTPLMAAIAGGDTALAHRLLAVPGIDLSIGDSFGGAPALIAAARCGDLALVEAMLAAGADAGVCGGDGRSAVAHAIEAGHPGIACRLLDAGAGGDLVGPLVDAAYRGQGNVVDRLLALGAPIDGTNSADNTALVGAAWSGRDAMVEALLDRGADLAASGVRALEFAANAGHSSTVRLLAGRGVPLDERNAYGWTPLMTAAWQGHDSVVAGLLALGADRHIKDDTGKTAIDWARDGNRPRVVSLLS
jgi:uncharacterized protein